MSLNLDGFKAQLVAAGMELRQANLPAEDEMSFMELSRWRAVEAQVQQLRNAITELVNEPAKERERQEVKQRAIEKENAA